MKKLLAFILSLSLLSSLYVSITNAEEINNEYKAHVLHASGVNQYGSNINDEEISQSFTTPMNISQEGDEIYVNGIINDESVDLTLKMRGKNEAENVIYFDPVNNTCDKFEILTAVYFNSFSSAVPLFKEEGNQHETMLRIYLKDNSATNNTSDNRNYFFIEVFDFIINTYNSLIENLSITPSDHWYAKEFLPIDTIIEKSEAPSLTRASTKDYSWKITQVYKDPASLTYDETIVVYLAHDIANIPVGGTEFWSHSIKVQNKYSKCREDSSLNENGVSCLEIKNPKLKAMTPKNTAFFSTKVSGTVQKAASITANVDLGFALSAKAAGISLNVNCNRGGTVALSKTYASYINSNSMGYSRNMNAKLNSRCTLRNIGHTYTVTNTVRDYGNKSTSSENISANWTFEVYNWMNNNSSTYTRTEQLTCRVI